MIQELYYEKLAGCWDAERRYIDEAYQTIPLILMKLVFLNFQCIYRGQ